MSRAALTPKREKFAQGIASGKSQTDAYRAAFSAKSMGSESVRVEAYRLMQNPHIALRIKEMTAKIVEKVGMTLESHLADLKALRNIATKEKQLAAAITAEIARGKASGVHVEQTKQTVVLGASREVDAFVATLTPEQKRLAARMRVAADADG
jgi:phage terminase small subunit